MAKKNPYIFTIGFDETDPTHVRAAGILNRTKKKAQLIAAAILSYVDGADPEKVSNLHVESFQPFLEKLIQKELEKVMRNQPIVLDDKAEYLAESVLDLSPKGNDTEMGKCMAQNIMNAMDVFRKK